jgi:hypothetical protein
MDGLPVHLRYDRLILFYRKELVGLPWMRARRRW